MGKECSGFSKERTEYADTEYNFMWKNLWYKTAVERQNEEAAQRNQKRVSTVDNHYICFKVEFTNVSNIPT